MSNPAYINRQTQADPGRLAPTHSPYHLRATAHLYGLASAALPTARILAIGCGSAEGLLPFAAAYPNARVVGIDSSDALLAHGTEATRRLKLENVELLHQEYDSLDEALGEFDYIIVTGLYSYLQADVAQSLLAYCARHLSPLGLLYVDYHVYPGAKAQEVVRDAVLLHAHAAQTEEEIKASAEAVLTLFSDGVASLNPMGQALSAMGRRFAAQIEAADDSGLSRALAGSACYFIEFAGRAAEAGLAYAGDSQPLSEIALNFGQGVSLSNSLLTLGQPSTLKQQYLDFATSRGFRQTILVSTERSADIRSSPDLGRLKDLRWASGLHRLAGYRPDGSATYVDNQGRGITIADTATQTVVNTLAHAWPGSLPYTTLLAVLMLRQNLTDAGARPVLDGALRTLLEHDVVCYSLDRSPYDDTASTGSHMKYGAPSLLLLNSTDSTFNFWHQPVHLHLSSQQMEMARDIAGGRSLGNLTITPDSGELGTGLRPGTSEISELLHVLRRYALVLVPLDAWIKLLAEGLTDSDAKAPYCGLYVAALARRSLDAGILCSDTRNTPPPPALLNQANRMHELTQRNDLRQAEPVARRLTQLVPSYIDAWEILTASLFNANKLDEALQSALRMLQHAPEDPRSFMLLSVSLSRLLRTSEAIGAARRAVELSPRNVEAHSALGDALNTEHRYYEARQAYEAALDCDPGHQKSRMNLCKVLIDAGEIEAAEKAARAAVDAFPDSPKGYDNLLFAANYSPDKTAMQVYQSYLECDKNIYQPFRNKWRAHTNAKDANRRLKVGYVSPDFRRHAANRFVEPLLEHVDRSRFELYAYAELSREDEVTQRLKPRFDHWVPTLTLDDSELAERIRADGIDVLIDIAGHTGGNRLGAFARKPAPVSATWLGYVYTTGLSAIDYILTDAVMTPSGTEEFFSERPWHLRSNLVYRPHDGMGTVNELPALENGHITLVTLTRAIRINHRTIRVWSEILRRLPTARLVVDSASYIDSAMRASLVAKFANAGISEHRLQIDFRTPPWDVLRGADIALDCFPHNSGTTLVESLYMGIPYVTLASRPGVGRIGGSLLAAVGCDDWITHSEDAYIEKVVALASDLPRLAEIRRGLRQQVQESVLMDEVGFTRDFESAIQGMFKNWCDNQK